jgi:glycerol kinase
MNTGGEILSSSSGLVSSVGWTVRGMTTYCLEGSVFNAGSAIQWLRDELGFFESSPQINDLAGSVPDTGGVYMVPAFTGLGAPYWDMDARGLICGITRGTGRAHIARAVLESIAFQTAMLIDAMEAGMSAPMKELRVDGGASASDFLMQFQADLLNIPVIRPSMVETTAAGAAYLAGLAAGVWADCRDLLRQRDTDRVFLPSMDESRRAAALNAWKDAVRRTLTK